MSNPIKYIFDKDRRVAFFQGIYIVFEFTSIIIFLVILLFGLFEFFSTLYNFFDSHAADKHNFTSFIKGLLSSFEIFFLAPIPILIIASFKRIIVKMFPLNIKMHPFETKDMISEEIAKKTFISSLIGVTSTFLLGKFIEIISLVPEESSYSNFTLSYDYVYLLILALVFLLLQIFLYLILSKSHKE